MAAVQRLSEVMFEIEESLQNRFSGRTFLIRAEVTDVKKYPDKKWCFLKFIEKNGSTIVSEIKGIFWSTSYQQIVQFEKATSQTFNSGLEITCKVKVKFHQRFGLNLEVVEIDYAYAIGLLEMQRKQTIDRLIAEKLLIEDENTGAFYSPNNQMSLPLVIQRVAFITAPGSDGQRDFQKVITDNKYGFAFKVTEYLTLVQGDQAPAAIMDKLEQIAGRREQFDLVVIARGGGSDTDFKSFNDYELAKRVALFPLPVLTGIGHDRNTSITDLVARQLRTPTEVATYIVDHNMNFDRAVEDLKDRFYRSIERNIERAKYNLQSYRQRIANLSPETVLKKGFAIVMQGGVIITDPAKLAAGQEIDTLLKKQTIHSTISKINDNDHTTKL